MQNKTTIEVKTAAVNLPVTLAMAKTYLRVDGSSDDDLITLYIQAATDAAQKYTRRYFITTTLVLRKDGISCVDDYPLDSGFFVGHYPSIISGNLSVNLPYPPIQRINSIKTYNTANTSATFSTDAYELDTEYGRIYLNNGYSWPTDLRTFQAFEIDFDCGYGDDPEDVPSAIR